jgi:hypothetical protein
VKGAILIFDGLILIQFCGAMNRILKFWFLFEMGFELKMGVMHMGLIGC